MPEKIQKNEILTGCDFNSLKIRAILRRATEPCDDGADARGVVVAPVHPGLLAPPRHEDSRGGLYVAGRYVVSVFPQPAVAHVVAPFVEVVERVLRLPERPLRDGEPRRGRRPTGARGNRRLSVVRAVHEPTRSESEGEHVCGPGVILTASVKGAREMHLRRSRQVPRRAQRGALRSKVARGCARASKSCRIPRRSVATERRRRLNAGCGAPANCGSGEQVGRRPYHRAARRF